LSGIVGRNRSLAVVEFFLQKWLEAASGDGLDFEGTYGFIKGGPRKGENRLQPAAVGTVEDVWKRMVLDFSPDFHIAHMCATQNSAMLMCAVFDDA
jgi:hypothetical protein